MKKIFTLLLIILALAIQAQNLEIITPTGHNEDVTSIAVSSDNKILISGSYDKTVKLWDIKTGFMLHSFSDLNNRIVNVDISTDGKYVLGGDEKNNYAVWQIPENELVCTFRAKFACFRPQSSEILKIADENIEILQFPENEVVSKFKYKQFKAETAKFSNDGSLFYCIEDNKLKVWNIESKKPILNLEEEKNINSAGFTNDNKFIIVDIFIRADKLIDLTTKKTIREYTKPYSKGSYNSESINIAPDNKSFAMGHHIDIYKIDIETGKLLTKIKGYDDYLNWVGGREKRKYDGHLSSITETCLSSDGRFIYSASTDHTIRMWDYQTGKSVKTFRSYSPKIEQVAVSSDGNSIALACDQILRLWDLSSLNIVRLFKGHSGSHDIVRAVAISPDNNYLLSAGDDEKIKYWDINTGIEKFSINKAHDFWITNIKFSSDGRYAYSGANDIYAVVKKWDLRTKQTVASYKGTSAKSYETCISKDEKYLVSACSYNKDALTNSKSKTTGIIDIWDLATGERIKTLRDHKQEVFSVDISPDGKYIISGSNDWTIKLWDFESGKVIKTFDNHKYTVTQVRFFDNAKKAVSASRDKTIRIWDIEKGETTKILRGHSNTIVSLSFSPDEKYLISAAYDGTIKIWDIENGKLLSTLIEVSDMWKVPIYRYKDEFKNELKKLLKQEKVARIVLLPNNYYMCSKEVAKYIAFRDGENIYPFELFDLRYNRPDIVIQSLPFTDKSRVPLYKKAYQKRLQKMGFTEEMLSGTMHIPTINLLNKNSLPISTKKADIKLHIEATDIEYNIDRINVWVNDIPIYGTKGIDYRKQRTHKITDTLQVVLSHGKNKIQVSTHNTTGVESFKQTVFINYDDSDLTDEQKKPDLYIVAIGVSKYKNPDFNLSYAAKDATDIVDLLQKQTAKYKKIHVLKICDADATKQNILQIKSQLLNSQVDDQVILFAAGHGLLDNNLDYYFATHDINFANPAEKGLPYSDLENLLDGIPARKKLMLIDACHSGELDKEGVEIVSTETTKKGTVSFRGFKKIVSKNKSDIGLEDSFELMKVLFADLRRGTGAMVISSAGGGEFAYEGDKWKNGVFTYSLLEGLESENADTNKDGDITVSELRNYVFDKVSKLTNGRQNPTSRRENLEFDFKVW